MGTLTREELFKRNRHFTVRRLREFLADNPDLSDDAVIVVQRVEDVYYEKHGWSTYPSEGEAWHHCRKWNEDIDSGKYLDRDQYPNMRDDMLVKHTEEQMEQAKDQYTPIWGCFKKRDENDIMFIDLHY